MTLAEATGCLSGPMDRLRQCFELSEPWEEFTAGTTHNPFIFNIQDEPGDREEFTVDELAGQRPLVYLVPDYPQGFTVVSDADGGSFRSGGVISAYIETEVSRLHSGTEITQQQVARLWDNFMSRFFVNDGSLFCIGWQGSAENNFVPILDIRRIDEIQLHTPNTITKHGQGDFVKAMFKVHWGRDT